MSQLAWQKSSFSTGGQGECVEVAASAHGQIHLRESDRPGEVLTTTARKLEAFLKGVKAGEFDDLAD
ncbi:DUF397 domain-containing protein [Streptomyces sp. RB6PN25]|uniref:DUF397 domain-containing protein n=1 Tax=Streptomyces humicola TaxID=2953240 RepID=A0ABT1PRR0_9ACTN|nr:DUF397 domain-containing protein [Streptomyces humicola]MCQ4080358.1 DUF397 domain-containing protein [Streptomyces humicola]